MRNMRKKFINMSLLVLFVTFIGILFMSGYAIRHYDLTPFLTNFFMVLKSYVKNSSNNYHDVHNMLKLDSIFLKLKGEIGVVPVDREGSGGGLTTFGNDVVVLTHEGKIYTATSSGDIRETQIETPDNGFQDYVRAAESKKYIGYNHDFSYFRYNDIMYFESDMGHGFAISYTEFDKDKECYGTAVALLIVDVDSRAIEQVSARGEDWNIIYRTQPCLPLKKEKRAIEGHMAGGRLAFAHPDTVLLASGDYHLDGVYGPGAAAQDPSMHYGKVIEIDLGTGEARILSSGHRNMQGISIDHDGELWVVEHGARGGDEINHVVAGENYGWPEETLGTLYNKMPWPRGKYGRHEQFRAPTFAWLPSVAPSGLTLIDGFHESWDGDLLMSTLSGQSLYRIRIKDDRVKFAERIHVGKRIRYVHQHSDGRLVLWTDDHEIIFLTIDEGGFITEFIEDHFEQSGYSEIERRSVQDALDSCMECHSFDPGDHVNAPSLGKVFNAPIGATSYRGYSEALKGRSGRWSRPELRAFLSNPAAYAPDTVMPDSGINDPFIVEELIDLLEAVTEKVE